MNKQEFLSHLKTSLACLPAEDINKSLDYYSEIIDDLVEDGASEEGAVASLGSPDEIASRIIADTPLPKLVKANIKPNRALKVWEIILLVLGAPVWLSVLIALFSVALSVYITLWSVVLTLFVTVLALFVSTLAIVVAAFVMLFSNHVLHFAVFLSSALICAGVMLLIMLMGIYAGIGLVYLTKWTINLFKKPFIKKGEM